MISPLVSFRCLGLMTILPLASAQLTAWSVEDGGGGGTPVTPADGILVSVDEPSFGSALFDIQQGGASSNSVQFPGVYGRDLECELAPSAIFHPDLAAKVPDIVTLTGGCVDDVEVTVVMNTVTPGSLSVTFVVDGETIYADHSSGETYQIIKKADIPVPDIDFEELGIDFDAPEYSGIRRNLKASSFSIPPHIRKLQDFSEPRGDTIHTFRLAIAANSFYSDYHQGSATDPEATRRANVLTAQTTAMARVNGIFLRELGVFFQFIADQDQLICLPTDTDGCATGSPNPLWSNNALDGAIDNYLYLQSRGVNAGDYDIGHIFQTGGGGIAALFALCNSDVPRKAFGATGLSNPTGDVFWVEYVSHESTYTSPEFFLCCQSCCSSHIF